MRTLLDRDHDLLGEEAPPSDLVLGAPALLGIFFALALICAVCFGFGYSSGHGLHLPAQTASSAASTPSVVPQQKPLPAAIQPEDGEFATAPQAGTDSVGPSTQSASARAQEAAKPAPGVSSPAQKAVSVADATPSATTHVPVTSLQQSSAMQVPTRADNRPVATAATPATAAATDGVSLSLMVQIAAVTHAADAQTLSTALRHDGFSAIVRTAPGDPFFHVQVGPFASRDAAKAMRTRLAASGYNAFIKQ